MGAKITRIAASEDKGRKKSADCSGNGRDCQPSAHSMNPIDGRRLGQSVSFRANSVRLKAEMHSEEYP